MNRTKLKQLAKRRLDGRVILCFAIMLLVGFLTGIISMVPGIGGLAVFILSGSIEISMCYIFYQMVAKDKKPEINDLMIGFQDDNFLRGLVGYLLNAVFVFLWSLLLVIPGIIKSISYSQMFFIMADDPKIDPSDAMKKSMKIMDGHKMDYFLLQLSFIPWHLLCALTLGILYIWVGPYINATNAAFYREVSGVKSQASRAVKEIAKEAEIVKKKVAKKAKAVKKAAEK